jgi:hypothetical protein
VKVEAVLRRVVEPAARLEGVVPVVLESGVAAHGRPQLDHLVVEVLKRVAVLEPAPGDQLPDFLAPGAVVLLEVAGDLLERLLLPVVGHRHRAHDLLVLLAQLGVLGLERDVRLAVELELVGDEPVHHAVDVLRKRSAPGMVEVELLQRLPPGLGERADDGFEVEILLLLVGVLGVAGHRDVAAARLLVPRALELAPVLEPRPEVRGLRVLLELVEEGLQLLPVVEIESLRNPPLGVGLVELHTRFESRKSRGEYTPLIESTP